MEPAPSEDDAAQLRDRAADFRPRVPSRRRAVTRVFDGFQRCLNVSPSLLFAIEPCLGPLPAGPLVPPKSSFRQPRAPPRDSSVSWFANIPSRCGSRGLRRSLRSMNTFVNALLFSLCSAVFSTEFQPRRTRSKLFADIQTTPNSLGRLHVPRSERNVFGEPAPLTRTARAARDVYYPALSGGGRTRAHACSLSV